MCSNRRRREPSGKRQSFGWHALEGRGIRCQHHDALRKASGHATLRLAAVLLAVISIFGCGGDRSPLQPAESSRSELAAPSTKKRATGDKAMQFKLTSTAFKPGGAIPRKHTGEGEDVSPPLAWDGAPERTMEFVLICDDPDAPTPKPWVHWLIYNMAAEQRGLPEAIPNEQQLSKPIPARQGKNSWDSGKTIGYRGPMPPPGHGTHHYHFKLYALDRPVDLAPAAAKEQLLAAIKDSLLGEAELIGTYERKK